VGALTARLKAGPPSSTPATHCPVRADGIDDLRQRHLRELIRFRPVAVGRDYRHQQVRLLVGDAEVRVLVEDGSLIRQLALDPGRA